MVDKKKLHESLGNFIDAVMNGEETDGDIFRSYTDGKVEDVLGEGASKFTLEGDDVMCGGKKIGTAVTDDEGSKLKFESDCGSHSKEFDTLEGLYEYLADNYELKEGAVERAKPALSKQDEKRGDRLARWSGVRGKKASDGKEGEYKSHDVRKEHGDKEKGASGGGNADDGMHDSRSKNGYYDEKGPRPEHSKSGPAHAGAEKDLETDLKYDSHDPRPHHKDPEKG